MYSVRRLVIGSCVPSAQTVLCSTKMIWESTFFISLFIYCFYLFLIFFVLFISLFIYYFYLFLIFFFFFFSVKERKISDKDAPSWTFSFFPFSIIYQKSQVVAFPRWFLLSDLFSVYWSCFAWTRVGVGEFLLENGVRGLRMQIFSCLRVCIAYCSHFFRYLHSIFKSIS